MNTFSHWLNLFILIVVCFSLATSTVHCETTTLQGHVPNTPSNLLQLSLFILIITGLPLESQSRHLLAGWWWDLANSFGVGKLRWVLVRVVGQGIEVELAGEGPRGLNRTQKDLVWRHTVNTKETVCAPHQVLSAFGQTSTNRWLSNFEMIQVLYLHDNTQIGPS